MEILRKIAVSSVNFLYDVFMPRINKKKKRIRIRVVILAFFLILYMGAGIGGGLIAARLLNGVPEFNVHDFISQETTQIYDARGNLVQELGTYLRDNIEYNSCPDCLIDAFLAIEDNRFFTHKGLDIPRFTKIVIDYIRYHDASSGGSTFTMQLVRNTYFSIEDAQGSVERERTLSYKMQQIWLSIKLERVMGKKEIFQLYLNKINFGKNIRGVQMASRYYFGKNCTDLTTSETALLAGIVNLPNTFNPYVNLDFATDRRNTVLTAMRDHGYLNEEEYQLALSVKVEDQLAGENSVILQEGNYQDYIDAVLNEAQQITGEDPYYTGMQIYTALEPSVQSAIESVEQSTSGIAFINDLQQIGIVSMNNRTGEIVGLGGGRNYYGVRLYNRATSAYIQSGSVIKPALSYALGYEYLGYAWDEILVDRPWSLPGESRVIVNATGEYEGDVTIQYAMARSLNIPAIRTLQDVQEKIGKEAVISYMQSIGFDRANEDTYTVLSSIGADTFTVTPLQMAGAHAMLLNEGVYIKPHTINKIITSSGEIIEVDGNPKRVLSSGSAYLVDQLMQNNVDSGLPNYMDILQRSYPVYAKTGTTDWGHDGEIYGIPYGRPKDAWMAASTSVFTNVVWLGWDEAVLDGHTYFDDEDYWKNIPGRVNQLLLDTEEGIYPDLNGGVEEPDDTEVIQYVYGTYPHIESDGSLPNTVQSKVSEEGLKNSPSVSVDTYRNADSQFKGIDSFIYDGVLYIQWNMRELPCSWYRDISQHNLYHDTTMTGACIVDNTWLGMDGIYSYTADVYVNDEYFKTVNGSSNGIYSGDMDDVHGEIKICGKVSNSAGSVSEDACKILGVFQP